MASPSDQTGGDLQTINWSYTGNPGAKVNILLYNGTKLSMTIKSGAPKSGSYSWTIPDTLAAGSDYRIRIVSALSGKIYGESTHFAIVAPTITLTSPVGGETWGRGTTQSVTWSYTGYTNNTNAKVKIQLFNGTTLVKAIATGVSTNSTSYSWAIPATQSVGTNYSININSTTNGKIIMKSGNFTIN